MSEILDEILQYNRSNQSLNLSDLDLSNPSPALISRMQAYITGGGTASPVQDNGLAFLDRLQSMQNQSWGDMGFGQKMGVVGQGLGALSSLGGLYFGLQNMRQSRDQFNFQRDYANTNLANQASLANQALESNIRSRYAGGSTPAEEAELARYSVLGKVGG